MGGVFSRPTPKRCSFNMNGPEISVMELCRRMNGCSKSEANERALKTLLCRSFASLTNFIAERAAIWNEEYHEFRLTSWTKWFKTPKDWRSAAWWPFRDLTDREGFKGYEKRNKVRNACLDMMQSGQDETKVEHHIFGHKASRCDGWQTDTAPTVTDPLLDATWAQPFTKWLQSRLALWRLRVELAQLGVNTFSWHRTPPSLI